MKRLIDLAQLISGRVEGDPDLMVSGASSVDRAAPGDITFALDAQRLERFLVGKGAAALVPESMFSSALDLHGKSVICCDDVEACFATVVASFRPKVQRRKLGISSGATVSPTACIAEDVDIYPGAFVGDGVSIGAGSVIYPNVVILEHVQIGERVQIYPGAVLYENTVVGDRCIIHAGAVLGAFGFGYRPNDGQHRLSPQLGNVVLENDVEVGANTTIDRGTYESTVIGRGTKLDNQVMIGHNCVIGRHNLLCSQVGIAGSSSTGDYVVMGGQVGIGDHLTVGDRATLCAKSGVMHHLDGNATYAGAPAVPARTSMQQHALVAKLPEMRNRLKQLERELKRLSQREAEPGPAAESGGPAESPGEATSAAANSRDRANASTEKAA